MRPVVVVRALRQVVGLEAALLGLGDVAGAHRGVGDAQEEVGTIASVTIASAISRKRAASS